MPRPLRLQIHDTEAGRTLTVRVTADSHGDIRPVQGATVKLLGGATVKLLGHTVTTNRRGVVVFKLPPAGLPRSTKVTVSAGDTFKTAVAPVRSLR